ncbi:TIGR02281 family clan AA aspartic protease [Allorhizobium borbori]|jgi:aspartyl protease family protein|uniref:Aspartyl protease family protein n=1 Tax=Allorhizobium borbori TaxID=485907 RepID=A0A7W6JY49_9HYPH|nr:TIGR02281 family clan AA aspartic protease [Allorhizobium borbori]MBB4101715.1 aspartyl protease family protein [Allorhizobium borbori]PZU21736.1 MAG: TIGR02281 family clan AA aspartic protease [Shinella sp.]
MTMRSLLFIAGLTAVAATQVPSYMERLAPPPRAETPAMAAAADAHVDTQVLNGSATLASDNRGHYSGSFRMNGKAVDGLVDTGASFVSVPESVARRLGFSGATLDFRHPVSTANGKAMGALVTLDRIEIGQVRVRNVTALVLKDDALSTTLIGNSFLKQLASYKVEGGQMKLSN